jgi:hypothetical protein
MKVFVIMGNDFPDCVFASEEAAEKFIEQKKAEYDKSALRPRIYWRFYEFEVRE